MYKSLLENSFPDGNEVIITVKAGERQKFAGFGTSQNVTTYYSKLNKDRKDLLNSLVWTDLKLKILKMWFSLPEYSTKPGEENMEGFLNTYVRSGMIADAMAYGVTTLLLAPGGLPPYMHQLGPTYIKHYEVSNYTRLIASFIKKLKDEYGILIHVTGICNEPVTLCAKSFFTPGQMVTAVKNLRFHLDQFGLDTVKIIAPENAEADEIANFCLDALKNDAEAWDALYGFATHSYNMAANNDIVKRLQGTGKEYWNTEAGGSGYEIQGDAHAGSNMATRALNDFNHLVTHWLWFIGFEDYWGHSDNQTRLIGYDASNMGDDWYTIFQKYYYLKQLSNTFDVGAVFRSSLSSLEGDMVWTNGRKPRITAAAAHNPDGSWGIGISNYTCDQYPISSEWFSEHGGYKAQTFNVTVYIEELVGSGEKVCIVHRSNSRLNCSEEEPVLMKDGRVKVDLQPLDLVTLRTLG